MQKIHGRQTIKILCRDNNSNYCTELRQKKKRKKRNNKKSQNQKFNKSLLSLAKDQEKGNLARQKTFT